MTYQEAISMLRRLDAVRNGETPCDDPDSVIVPILDAMPQILFALDPSRHYKSPHVPEGAAEDTHTRVARRMWAVAWGACNAFNYNNERDLYQGDPCAMVVQEVLAKAMLDSKPLSTEREAEYRKAAEAEAARFGPLCQRHGSDVVLSVLDALAHHRARADLLASENQTLRAASQRSLLVERIRNLEAELRDLKKGK